MNNKKAVLLLILIVSLGLGIRVYHLERIPSGFFCDEAANGFNAYMLAQKGTDEYGVLYPFFFRSFGDYRNPVTIYSMIPFVKLLGLKEFSVRAANAVYGTLTIITVFLLTKALFNQKAAFFSALLLAISPWHIHFSRTGFEFIPFPFYFSLALLLFLKSFKKHWLLIPSVISWGLAFYTYYPSQIVVPIFLLLLIIIYRRAICSVRKKTIVLSLIIMAICFLPFLIGIKQGTILTRFKNVSIFETKPFFQAIRLIFLSFLNHFSFSFLFTKGDIDFPGHFITRHSIRGIGQLYLFQLPLVIIGAQQLIKKAQRKKVLLVLLWILIYPLGSIFTENGPYAHRSIIGVIPFQILSGIALDYLINFSNKQLWFKKLITSLLVIIISLSFANYSLLYFSQYPLYSSDFWGWQQGPKEIINFFRLEKNNYDQLILIGNFNAPEIFFKFYDPDFSCKNCSMGNFKSIDLSKKQLFAIGADRINEIPESMDFDITKIIYYPNQSPAFFIGKITYQ